MPPNTILLIPVFNEEKNVGPICAEIRECLPSLPVCFIDDCSTDGTVQALRTATCRYVSLPCNLGVGGAMQAGFRYAYANGYDYAIRIDGDGQHPPSECAGLAARMARGDVDMVVGSRFLGERSYTSTWYRHLGILGLAGVLSLACRRKITDPTSGFQMVNRAVMHYFAHQYPVDYPEPESLALLSRQGYRVCETPAKFRPRTRGTSSIKKWGTLYYMFKVGVALFVDRCRAVDPRYDRQNIEAAP
jgi:glycosyltransferase involved in cell wall biosynthesis